MSDDSATGRPRDASALDCLSFSPRLRGDDGNSQDGRLHVEGRRRKGAPIGELCHDDGVAGGSDSERMQGQVRYCHEQWIEEENGQGRNEK